MPRLANDIADGHATVRCAPAADVAGAWASFTVRVVGFWLVGFEKLVQKPIEPAVMNLKCPPKMPLVLRVQDVIQKLVELLNLSRETDRRIFPRFDYAGGQDAHLDKRRWSVEQLWWAWRKGSIHQFHAPVEQVEKLRFQKRPCRRVVGLPPAHERNFPDVQLSVRNDI
jgi:hypothetical protein